MREDRFLLGALLAVLVFVFGLVMFIVQWIVSVFGAGPDLLGPAASILLGIAVSLLVICVLALFSGDGLIGELPTALSGFVMLSVGFSALALIML
ncbi:hypothetical protein [Paracoccus sp. ME4]|uniref:hypothetical protein n=1 Tax=Paracoccus sp. ME4 TaxID=3138066 RepID=UPI00398B792A